jgi:16S rRNA (guanine527-N7)-methyltransferase
MVDLEKLLRDELGLELSTPQIDAFHLYESTLREWNQKFNLTAITDPDEVRVKHFYDSLTCLSLMPSEQFSLIDIGSGAGFPGIPIKLLRPHISLCLVESVGKKTEFLSALVSILHLQDVSISTDRAENVGRDPKCRDFYDWAVARAVAPLPVLVEYLLPLVHVGGNVLAQKGSGVSEEIEKSNKAIRLLGGEITQILEINLPVTNEKRSLIRITKKTATPPQYPRRVGLPHKKPLI